MKIKLFTEGDAALERVRAAGELVATPPEEVHSGAARLVETTTKAGWSVPYAIVREWGTTRVAVLAEDDFASTNPDLANAADGLPDNWAFGPSLDE